MNELTVTSRDNIIEILTMEFIDAPDDAVADVREAIATVAAAFATDRHLRRHYSDYLDTWVTLEQNS